MCSHWDGRVHRVGSQREGEACRAGMRVWGARHIDKSTTLVCRDMRRLWKRCEHAGSDRFPSRTIAYGLKASTNVSGAIQFPGTPGKRPGIDAWDFVFGFAASRR